MRPCTLSILPKDTYFMKFEEFFELIGDYAKVGYAHFNILSKQGHAQKSWYKNIGEEQEAP